MKMTPLPITVTEWTEVEPSEHPGDRGVAFWRTKEFGDIRVRMVEYSAGYVADHWCSKGHVILCLGGSLEMELRNGRKLALKQGQSYEFGDGEPAHRSSTEEGAQLFIVD
jgi:hypothetical protein